MLASSPLSSLVIAMSSKASCSVIIAQHLKGSWVVQELLLCQPSEAAIFGKGSSYLHLPLYLTLNSPHNMICLCLSDAWVLKKIFKPIYLCFFVSLFHTGCRNICEWMEQQGMWFLCAVCFFCLTELIVLVFHLQQVTPLLQFVFCLWRKCTVQSNYYSFS